MYYVTYVNKLNGETVTRSFDNVESAIRFYRENVHKMAYGFISDDEALETAETVKADFERELSEALSNDEEYFIRALLS